MVRQKQETSGPMGDDLTAEHPDRSLVWTSCSGPLPLLKNIITALEYSVASSSPHK